MSQSKLPPKIPSRTPLREERGATLPPIATKPPSMPPVKPPKPSGKKG